MPSRMAFGKPQMLIPPCVVECQRQHEQRSPMCPVFHALILQQQRESVRVGVLELHCCIFLKIHCYSAAASRRRERRCLKACCTITAGEMIATSSHVFFFFQLSKVYPNGYGYLLFLQEQT
jgi:hypothetical protein